MNFVSAVECECPDQEAKLVTPVVLKFCKILLDSRKLLPLADSFPDMVIARHSYSGSGKNFCSLKKKKQKNPAAF
jgi:hypothetical protein